MSRSQVVWRTQLQRQEVALHLPRFSPDALKASAEELEQLATSRFRLKHNLRMRKQHRHSVQSYALQLGTVNPATASRHQSAGTLPLVIQAEDAQMFRAAAWIAPGWLLTGSYLLRTAQPKSCIKLWNTGHSAVSQHLSQPVAEYHLTSLPGSVAEFSVAREQIGDNTYLVMVCPWT